MYREKTRWCKICHVFHPANASRFKHVPPVYYEPKDFDEYVLRRLDGLSQEAKDDFDINPQKFHMMRAFWHTQYLDAKGDYETANQERTELDALLRGAASTVVRDERRQSRSEVCV